MSKLQEQAEKWRYQCIKLKHENDELKKENKMLNGYTDKVLLDYLQQLTDEKQFTGMVILRDSTTNRGWRFHETLASNGVQNIRQAIINYIEEKKRAY